MKGILRPNSNVHEYNLFDEDENPKSGLNEQEIRTQHASIIYCSKSQLATKQENINVLLPKILEDGSYHTW
jgi:hypothetical protein